MRYALAACLALALAGCGDDRDPTDAGRPRDAGRLAPGQDAGPRSDAGSPDVDGGPAAADAGPAGGDAGGGGGVTSTLQITCAGELTGRAIVNENSNLGVAFTDGAPTFTPRGSISFDFPAGFSGVIDNPEVVNGGPRHTLAITTRDFTTYGNHCWPAGTPPRPGMAVIEAWRPTDGVVRARFVDVPLHNCVTMGDTCVLNGTLETTGEGVFE